MNQVDLQFNEKEMENNKTMLECLDDVSRSKDYRNWMAAIEDANAYDLNDIPQEAGKLYADQFKLKWIPVTASLPKERCSCIVEVEGLDFSLHVMFVPGIGFENDNVVRWILFPEPPKK